MRQTQNQQILEFLKGGRSITPIEALNHIGCMRLASRISDLKKEGHDIKSEMVHSSDTGKKYARYWLAMLLLVPLLLGCATVSTLEMRQKYVNTHPQISEKFKQAILEKKLFMGMSKSDVIAIMGVEPCDSFKHITATRYGIHEQWVYDFLVGQPTYYIYFDNDKLSGVQKN
jgi:hypothetical protein